MFKHLSVQSQVSSFELWEDSVFLWKKDNITKKKCGTENTIELTCHFENIDFQQGQILLTKDWIGNKTILNDDLGHVKNFNTGDDGLHLLLDDNLMFHKTFNEDYSRAYLELFSIEEEARLWTIEYDYYHLVAGGKFLCFSDGKSILVSDRGNPQNVRIFSLDELHQTPPIAITKMIGVWRNLLIVACTNHTILCLDLISMSLLHLWRSIDGFNLGPKNELNSIPRPEQFILDQGTAKLIALTEILIEIDLITKKLEWTDLRHILRQEHRVGEKIIIGVSGLNNYPVTKDHIFITAICNPQEEYNETCLLALNRERKELDWRFDFEAVNLGVNAPALSSDEKFLYQLDQEGNLYSFLRVD